MQFTSEKEWRPYKVKFKEAEEAAIVHHTAPDLDHQHHKYRPEDVRRGSIGRVSVVALSNDSKFNEPTLYTFDEVYSNEQRRVDAINSRNQRSLVDNKTLARRWGVSEELAEKTRKVMTQRGVQTLTGSIGRRFWTRQHQLASPLLMTKVYSNTMFSEKILVIGNTCAQLHMTAEGYASGDPLRSKADAHTSLEKFCREDGIPHKLVTDRAREELYGDWGRFVKENLIDQRTTKPHSGWQNKVESEIKEFKKHHHRMMALHRCPDAFWDYGWVYTRYIRKFLVRNASHG